MITAHTVLPDSMVYVRAFTVLNDDAFRRHFRSGDPVRPLYAGLTASGACPQLA